MTPNLGHIYLNILLLDWTFSNFTTINHLPNMTRQKSSWIKPQVLFMERNWHKCLHTYPVPSSAEVLLQKHTPSEASTEECELYSRKAKRMVMCLGKAWCFNWCMCVCPCIYFCTCFQSCCFSVIQGTRVLDGSLSTGIHLAELPHLLLCLVSVPASTHISTPALSGCSGGFLKTKSPWEEVQGCIIFRKSTSQQCTLSTLLRGLCLLSYLMKRVT